MRNESGNMTAKQGWIDQMVKVESGKVVADLDTLKMVIWKDERSAKSREVEKHFVFSFDLLADDYHVISLNSFQSLPDVLEQQRELDNGGLAESVNFA